MNYAKTIHKLREQIIKFSGELSLGWPKVMQRFIVRLKVDRHLVYRDKKLPTLEHASRCPMLYAENIVKQKDIRLLTYRRLQNMMALVLTVAHFAMVYLGIKTKLRVLARHVLKAARQLFGIPDFRFYALADGIRELLFGRQKGLECFTQMLKIENQKMKLFDP